MTDHSTPPPRLAIKGIRKVYPSVIANDDVNLTVMPGEIHAILGENGAGKSTLMKIIYGVTRPDEGEIYWEGKQVHIHNPGQARNLGIGMVFQHFSLFETLSVVENTALALPGNPDHQDLARRIEKVSNRYGLPVDPRRLVHALSVGERQRVEIIRCLLQNPKLLILDEPTSVLTPQAVEKLFVVLRRLAAEGCSILYISHKLHEIRSLCTACTVLRGGVVTGECNPANETNASLSRMMIGSEPPELEHRTARIGDAVLRVNQLSLRSQEPFGVDLHDMSLQVRAGEVVGIAGVSGNGQKELMYALSGEDTRSAPEMVQVLGKGVGRMGPGRRRGMGLHFVPEERLGRGAVPSMGLAHNLLLTRKDALGKGGWIRMGKLHAQARDIIRRFNVKAGGPDSAAQSLSGGNLQKFIVGREIDAKPRLLIISQPTWGVDVGAAAQIRGEILQLRDQGCAVLVLSEELDELFEICDRLHVVAKGRLSPSVQRADATVQQIGEWMSGLWDGAAVPAIGGGTHAQA